LDERLLRWRGWRQASLVVAILLASWQFAWGWVQADKNQYDDDIRHVVEWLHDHSDAADRVLLDQRFHPYAQIESRLPLAQFVDLRWSPDRKQLDEKAFTELISKRPPTIVVLDYFLIGTDMVNSNLDVFRVSRGAEETTSRGLRFRKAFAEGDFVIYRTSPAEASP